MTMHILRWSACLFVGLLACAQLQAQSCAVEVNATTPQSRFTINEETVSDGRTGLVWLRCPVGFELDRNGTPEIVSDDRCRLPDGATLDDATVDWQTALLTAEQLNAAGGIAGDTDWRLPNIKELLSIVERQCVFPAINTTAFPDTPGLTPRVYWSSSPFNASNARVLDFSTGTVSSTDADRAVDVNLFRLVRSGRYLFVN